MIHAELFAQEFFVLVRFRKIPNHFGMGVVALKVVQLQNELHAWRRCATPRINCNQRSPINNDD